MQSVNTPRRSLGALGAAVLAAAELQPPSFGPSREPEGTVYMHHAQDRLIDVPLTERDGKRGGIHNSLTRVLMKPNHMVGGYAQLAYFFNYIGPIGNNRDEVTTIRKRTTKVEY